MCTAGIRPVAIKIEPEIKERLKRLADSHNRTPTMPSVSIEGVRSDIASAVAIDGRPHLPTLN